MKKQRLLLFAVFLTCVPGMLSTHATECSAHTQRPEKRLAMQIAARALLEKAIQDEKSARFDRAIRRYRLLVNRSVFLRGEEVPKIHFCLAKLLQRRKRLRQAFNAYQILITRYPSAKYFNAAIAEQTRIANFYLEKPDSAFMRVLMSNGETAQRMYESILLSAPFGRYASLVQFNLCLAHERQGHVYDAVQGYQTLFEKYPDSKLASHAQYQIACIHMRVGLSKYSQDLSVLSKAIDAFHDYLSQYPETRYKAKILENIETIKAKLAENIYRIATFYDHRHDYKSAYIYYNEVRHCQPTSLESILAKIRMAVIDGTVKRPLPVSGLRKQLRPLLKNL